MPTLFFDLVDKGIELLQVFDVLELVNLHCGVLLKRQRVAAGIFQFLKPVEDFQLSLLLLLIVPSIIGNHFKRDGDIFRVQLLQVAFLPVNHLLEQFHTVAMQ